MKSQKGFAHLLVILLLVVGLVVGIYVALNPVSFRGKAASGNIVSSGVAGPGQVFEPRPGTSCSLGAEVPTCMYPLAAGYICQRLCCGYISGSSCLATPGLSNEKGLLGAGFSLLKINGQSSKTAEYRGIPESRLSKKVIIPTFYINFSDLGYNSVAQISNVDDVDTTLNISFYVTDNFNDIPSQKYSKQAVLKAHQSIDLSLGSDDPFIRDLVLEAKANNRDYVRSMGIIESTNARIIGSVLTFSHSKKAVPENSQDKTADVNSAINQKILFENRVSDYGAMKQALLLDIANPQDYFMDTMRPFGLGDDNLIIHQLVSKVENEGVEYNGGFVIANPTDQTVNFKINLISRDFNGPVYTLTNPLLLRAKLSESPLKPYESRSYFVQTLQQSIPLSPDFPVNFNSSAEIVADSGSKLFGFYYYSRENNAFGRGTAAFWADAKSDLDQCSTTYPLFNNVSYEGINSMVSGLSVRAFLGSGNVVEDYINKDNPSVVTHYEWSLGDQQALLHFLPKDRSGKTFPNSVFAAKVCKNNGAVGSSANSFRNNNNASFINFGLTGFPDSWQNKTYYIPYLMYNSGNSKAESWAMPYNPNIEDMNYGVRFYMPNGSYQDFGGGSLKSHSFENRVFGPTQPFQGGYIKVSSGANGTVTAQSANQVTRTDQSWWDKFLDWINPS